MLKIESKHKDESVHGNDCWFIESMGKGIKFYQNECDRDEAYKFQTYLHSKGLAPRTYFKGKGSYSDYHRQLFFYETEVAETMENCNRDVEEFMAIYDLLENALRAVGVDYCDWISRNVGFIDGQPVVIDCGYPMRFRLTSAPECCIVK